MTHKLKTLGVALFAVLALTAVAATAASAAKYTASTYPTTGTGESELANDTFITEAGAVECKSHYQGTLSGASEDLTVTAKYTNCRAFSGLLSATVSNCTYTFTAPTGTGPYSANVHVVNSACTIEAGTCKISVPTQGGATGLSKVTITNTKVGDVEVQAAVTGIKYTVVTDGFGCPLNGTGEKTGAEYKQHKAITFDSTNGATIDVG